MRKAYKKLLKKLSKLKRFLMGSLALLLMVTGRWHGVGWDLSTKILRRIN